MTNFNHNKIPEAALAFHEEGQTAALATVIQTWGSAPRPVGAQMAVSGDGVMYGSVSGGCVEGAVVLEALEAIEQGNCRILEYGVSQDEAFAVGLACGGTIRIMIEPIGRGNGPDVALIERLVHLRTIQQMVAYLVNTDTWQRELVTSIRGPFGAAISEAISRDQSVLTGNQFIGIMMPDLPLRLAVIGAAHIAQPLCQIARLAGYGVSLIDPRESFASPERFPDETVITDWPDQALWSLKPDRRLAVVTLSHDPKIDNPALELALKSDVFYIGALGSRKTHAKRVDYLQAAGFDDDQIARIHGPVGLNIGAKTPAEIAIAIMAEITEALRGAK